MTPREQLGTERTGQGKTEVPKEGGGLWSLAQNRKTQGTANKRSTKC